MFSYKLIERKVNKTTTPLPTKENIAKRKRKMEKTMPGPINTKRQCKDSTKTEIVLLNPNNKINVNKNKISNPNLGKNLSRRGRKKNKHPECQEVPSDLVVPDKVPILYAESKDGHRCVWHKSGSDYMTMAPLGNMDSSEKHVVKESSDSEYSFDGREVRDKNITGLRTEESDSEYCFDGRKDGFSKEMIEKERNSDFEYIFDGRKEKKSKMKLRTTGFGPEKVDECSDFKKTFDGRKEKYKEIAKKKNKNTDSLPNMLNQTSDSENHMTSTKNKKKHYTKKKNKKTTSLPDNEDQISDSDQSITSVKRKNKLQNTKKNKTTIVDQTSESESSIISIRQKLKNAKREKNTKKQPENTNKAVVGECKAVTETGRGTVVAAIKPLTTLYLQGCMVVCPIVGNVEILGYVLQQGQSLPMYSLPSSSLLGVTALEGKDLDVREMSVLDLPSSWLENLVQEKETLVLLEITQHSSPRLDFLVSVGWRSLIGGYEYQKPWHSVGTSIVTPRNCHKHRVTYISPEWRDAANTVVTNFKCDAVPRVVVGGGKSVGKSTFFKYLVNSLLSAKSGATVLCLDLDPGQPELSLPTSLSLTHITKPLLGPAYTHDSSISLDRTHILVGSVSPQFIIEEYVNAVKELCSKAGVMSDEVPLLVNTMGWTQGTGFGLMIDIVRIIKPTHVVQIEDHRRARNFPFPLHSEAMNKAKGGITTAPGQEDLYYNLTLLPRGGLGSSAPHMAHPKVLRELRILAEAGMAMESSHKLTVPWSDVALHVCEEQVPKDRILQAINGQLVGLCNVNLNIIHTLHPDLPHLLTANTGFGHLLGWGIVEGVDVHNNTLHIATTLKEHNGETQQDINAIVMPRIHLTAPFYKLFCIGNGPYLEVGKREGAGRLRVGRRIKPRRHQD